MSQCRVRSHKRSRWRTGSISLTSEFHAHGSPDSDRLNESSIGDFSNLRYVNALCVSPTVIAYQVYKVLEDALIAKNKAERDLKTYTNLVGHSS